MTPELCGRSVGRSTTSSSIRVSPSSFAIVVRSPSFVDERTNARDVDVDVDFPGRATVDAVVVLVVVERRKARTRAGDDGRARARANGRSESVHAGMRCVDDDRECERERIGGGVAIRGGGRRRGVDGVGVLCEARE